MSIALLFVPILFLVLLWAVIVYNLLVRDRNRVSQGWSDVDVQLKRRHDLVPRLVDIVKGYAGYERALLTSLAELRTQGLAETHPAARGAVEQSVGSGVRKLVALVEAYPDLKASGNFLDLQRQLADTENQIQFARRYYNGAVNLFNVETRTALGFRIEFVRTKLFFPDLYFFDLLNQSYSSLAC